MSPVSSAQDVGRLPAIDADAERANHPAVLDLAHGALPVLVRSPRIRPDVKLLDVDRLDAQVREALLRVGADVVGGVGIVQRVLGERRPAHVLRRDLGRQEHRRVRISPPCFAEDPLAAAHAVHPGGVEEVASARDRRAQRRQRFVIVGAGPTAHAPHAVADLGHLPARAAVFSIAHTAILQADALRCGSGSTDQPRRHEEHEAIYRVMSSCPSCLRGDAFVESAAPVPSPQSRYIHLCRS